MLWSQTCSRTQKTERRISIRVLKSALLTSSAANQAPVNGFNGRFVFPPTKSVLVQQNRFWCEMFQHSARCLNIPHQIDFSCRRIIFPTTKSVLEFEKSFCHRMLKDFIPNRFFLQKDRFCYNKIRFGIPECFLSQNVERFHTKSIFPASKSFLV